MAERSPSLAQLLVWKVALYSFGIFNWFLYLGLAISGGSFFKKETEQDVLQLAIGKSLGQYNVDSVLSSLSQPRTSSGTYRRPPYHNSHTNSTNFAMA